MRIFPLSLTLSQRTVVRNVDFPIPLALSVAAGSKHILGWKYLRPRFSSRRTGFRCFVLAQLSSVRLTPELPPSLCFNNPGIAYRFGYPSV